MTVSFTDAFMMSANVIKIHKKIMLHYIFTTLNNYLMSVFTIRVA